MRSISMIKQYSSSLLAIFALLSITACTTSSSMHQQTVPNAAYKDAQEWTNPQLYLLPEPGSVEETEMLDAVKSLFSEYTPENLAANVQKVYAEKIYFRDAFEQLDSSEDLKAYFLKSMESLEACEFIFNRISRSGGDFYIDWTMRVDFKKTPKGTWEESMGITRMRFNSEGQVIFHQDYWDPTDIIYVRIPIAKQLIAYTKRKL